MMRQVRSMFLLFWSGRLVEAAFVRLNKSIDLIAAPVLFQS